MAGTEAASMQWDKERTRLLRFLLRGPASVAVGCDGARATVEADSGGAIGVAVEALTHLCRQDLAEVRGDRVVLTDAGQSLARRLRATGDAFLDQHRDLARKTFIEKGGRIEVEINLSESPLGQLARRKDRDGRPYLEPAELRAGERLRSDYERARLMPRLGANWQAAVASGRRDGGRGGLAELTDAAIAARQRVERAMAAVGPELSGVLIDVCCFLKGLEAVEAERSWPVRSGKIILKCALGALSRHYEPASSRMRRKPVLHWGAEGYRPSLNPA